MQGGYNRVLEFDLIHYKVRQDLPAIQALEWEISQSGLPQEDLRKAAWKGWLYRNAREYHDNGYSYPQYVLEWARKSVWRSGYMPISGRAGEEPVVQRGLQWEVPLPLEDRLHQRLAGPEVPAPPGDRRPESPIRCGGHRRHVYEDDRGGSPEVGRPTRRWNNSWTVEQKGGDRDGQ